MQRCEVSQKAKAEHCKLPGLLKPHDIPPHRWHTLNWDFMEGLPKSQGTDVILVMIDKLTKYGHFLPLKHPYTAPQVAHIFFDQVYQLHGMPQRIIPDHDPVFTSLFWQELFCLSDTILNMSSARHTEADGQTERLNQCMEHSSAALLTTHQTSGHVGCHWLSIGTTFPSTQPRAAPLSKLCMVICLVLLAWKLQLPQRIFASGSMNKLQCWNR